MNQGHIPGFPNRIHNIDWQTGLPRFQGNKGEFADIHLVRFRFHIHNLDIDFPEDCLMKIFMITLEDEARF